MERWPHHHDHELDERLAGGRRRIRSILIVLHDGLGPCRPGRAILKLPLKAIMKAMEPLEDLEMAGGVLLPDFKFRFFLEDAHKDRRMLRHVLLLEQGGQLFHCLGRQLWPSSLRHPTSAKQLKNAADTRGPA